MSTSVEDLQLKVEELLYKQNVDTLVSVAEKLKYEAIEELKGKSRIRAINLVRRHIEEVVEGSEGDTSKTTLLNNVLSELGGLEIQEQVVVNDQEVEMLTLQQEYEKLKLENIEYKSRGQWQIRRRHRP